MAAPVGIFIAKVGAAIISGLSAFIGGSAALFVVDYGIKLAALSFLSSIYQKLAGVPDFGTQIQQQTVTTRGTIEHQRIIYGETVVSGPLWYLNSAGSTGEKLYHGVVVAGHEIEDITDMWFDDHKIDEAAIDWSGDGSVDSGDFRGNLAENPVAYFYKHLGTYNQAANAELVSQFTEITSQHQGRGLAYFVARCDYVNSQTQVWSAGAPKNYKATVKGKKVYNPSSDSTQSFGTGPHRLANSLTWEYTDSGPLIWADCMIDASLGFEEAASRINYGYVASADNVARGIIYTPVGTDYRFRTNGVLTTGDTHENNLEKILSSFNGTMNEQGGTWYLRAWSYETPTLSYTDDNVRDDLQIKLHADEDDLYNIVRGYFVDKDRLYTANQFPQFASSEYIARDGGRKLYRDIQLPMTTDVYMAQRLAAGILEQSDLQTSVIYPSNYQTMRASVGGTIQIDNAKMDWSNKVFRVHQYKFGDMSGIDLVLKEDDASAYTDVGTAEYTVSSMGVYVKGNPGVPAPNSMWTIDVTNNVEVHIQPPPARLYETIQIWNNRSNVLSNANLVYEGKALSFMHKVDVPGEQYYWSRATNYMGAFSDFFPNSNATDIIGQATDYESLTDYTFDKGVVLTDFWTGNTSLGLTLANSEGINNSRAVSMIHSYQSSPNNHRIQSKVAHHIISDNLRFRFHYRVNSYAGVSGVNSIGLLISAIGWNASPVAPSYPPKYPVNTGSWVVSDDQYWTLALLGTGPGWALKEITLSTSASWSAGYKLGNVLFGVFVDAGEVNSNYLHIYIDNISLRYIT
jgi:hypothetical protein